jgi:hypothetical protein
MQITKGEICNTAANELLIQGGMPNSINPPSMVYPINKKYATIAKQANGTVTGDTLIWTTPNDSDRDFYLTFCSVYWVKDAANTGTATSLKVYVEGVEVQPINIGHPPSVAGGGYFGVAFPFPLKIDKNTAINVRFSFAAGTASYTGHIQGFML